MWISMFEFNEAIPKFKDYLTKLNEEKWGSVNILSGFESQLTFLYQDTCLAMYIRPHFVQREIEINVFETEPPESFLNGRVFPKTKGIKTLYQPVLVELINRFKQWLQLQGIDGFLSFDKDQEDMASSFESVYFPPKILVPTGSSSQNIIKMMSMLPLMSCYQGKRYRASLDKHVFMGANMLVNWLFYPTPLLTFTHAPHHFSQMEDLEEYYIYATCESVEDLTLFLNKLDEFEQLKTKANEAFTSSISPIYSGVSTSRFYIGITIDQLRIQYQSHAQRDQKDFDTLEEAVSYCLSKFEIYARMNIVIQKIHDLIKIYDKDAEISYSSIVFFKQKLHLHMSYNENQQETEFKYYFQTEETHTFDNENALYDELSSKISTFAKQHRLHSLFE